MQIDRTTKEFYNFLKTEKNCSPLTIDAYKRDMNLFIHFLELSSLPTAIEKITVSSLRKYISYLGDECKFKATTVNRKINSLRSYFKFLLSQEYLDKNPAAAVTAPKKPERIPIYLKENELKRLLEAPEKYSKCNSLRDKTILMTFIYTGIRRSELLALNWEDIDFGQRIIVVRKGKGNKQRIIPMQDELQEVLWNYLQSRLPLKDNCVFLSEENNRLSVTALQQMFVRYLKLSSLTDKGFTIHKLRHSFASLLIKKEVDLITIQELMGHSDLNSTKIYTHINTEHKRKQIDKLNIL